MAKMPRNAGAVLHCVDVNGCQRTVVVQADEVKRLTYGERFALQEWRTGEDSAGCWGNLRANQIMLGFIVASSTAEHTRRVILKSSRGDPSIHYQGEDRKADSVRQSGSTKEGDHVGSKLLRISRPSRAASG